MSYPYPYRADRNLWASFSLFEPEVGEVIAAPDGEYRVLAVLRGTHCSTGLMSSHEHLANWENVPEGWFWYGVKEDDREQYPTDAMSEHALNDWKRFQQFCKEQDEQDEDN